MSMQEIRATYGVPAKRGGLVRCQGVLCRILSAERSGMRLYIKEVYYPNLRRKQRRLLVHPTWEIEYLDSGGEDR